MILATGAYSSARAGRFKGQAGVSPRHPRQFAQPVSGCPPPHYLVVLHKSLASIYPTRTMYAARVVTLRPKGAATCQPRASPWVCDAQCQKILKGRNKQSIPDESFIKLETMATQEHSKLLLRRHRPMTLFLLLDVPPHIFYLRLAHGKRPVSTLPTKRCKRLPLCLDPF